MEFRHRVPGEFKGVQPDCSLRRLHVDEREMKYRQKLAKEQGVPMTNYGILIAHTQGILRRSLEPFPDILKLLEE